MAFKKYLNTIDNTEVLARAYVLGEDLTYINHGQHTPEEGDMVAYIEDGHHIQFLINAAEFNADFVEIV